MNMLLVPVGSHGDVHPFVGLGGVLAARGHRVTVLANPHFESLIRSAGLAFHALGDAEAYQQLAREPDLWHPRRAFPLLCERGIIPAIRPVYDAIAQLNEPGNTVVVASTIALGARIAQERLRVPTVTVHLQPTAFRGNDAPPKLPGVWMPGWMPVSWKRKIYDVGDRRFIDPVLAEPINAARRDVGLTAEAGCVPASFILRDWFHSPDLVLGFFPDWFAPPQRGWPANYQLVGFPLYDEADVTPISPALDAWLEAGPSPVAFTFGSAMWTGKKFFAAAADACRRNNRRGVLLTRHRENLPADVPAIDTPAAAAATIVHVPYAPFGQLLPRCAALVHHGGIGTTSQALVAGIPQVIMPLSHDQPDNAERLIKLGVGATVYPRWFTGRRVAKLLRQMIASPDVAAACKTAAAKFQNADALDAAADAVETLAASSRTAVQSTAPSRD